MSKKWTIEEFEDKKKALETKKARKKTIKNGVNTAVGAIGSSSIFLMLYKIADITY